MEHKVAKMNDIDRLAVSDTCIMMIHEKFGAGAVLNILMMMAANLVGFVIGTDGMQYMLRQIADSWDGACSLLELLSKDGLMSSRRF